MRLVPFLLPPRFPSNRVPGLHDVRPAENFFILLLQQVFTEQYEGYHPMDRLIFRALESKRDH